MTEDEKRDRLAEFAVMVTEAPEYGELIATVQRQIVQRWCVSNTLDMREQEFAKWQALAEVNATLTRWKTDKQLKDHFADQTSNA